jgi:hypothetical protein
MKQFLMFAALILPTLASAAEPELGWKTEAEAGLVTTSGNTKTTTVNV